MTSLLLVLLAAAPVTAPARAFTLDDVNRIVRLPEARIAPDARAVLLLAETANEAENRYDGELFYVDTANGARRSLVKGRPGLASPRWSPRGDRIAFLAADSSGRAQAYVLAVGGGDVRAVTASPTDVEQFAWSPDASRIAFLAADPAPVREGAARFADAFEVGHNSYLDREAPRPSHLWIVPSDGGTARRVTSGSGSLSTGLGPSILSWSPDGRRIAVSRFATPFAGDADRARVELVDVETGAARPLTGEERLEAAPVFSPDGGRVAYLHSRDGDPTSVAEALVASANGGAGVSTTRALDRNLTWLHWRPDGRALLVGGTDGTRVALWEQPLPGTARPLDLGALIEIDDFSQAADGTLALVGSTEDRPGELYVAGRGRAPRRLTDFHGWVEALGRGRSEAIEWRSDDGFVSDGVLTHPPAFDPTRRYPLVLLIHGGPTAASNRAFSDLAQLMAARGWLVLQPNYRGSDNRGEAHQRGIVAGAGEGPGRDVMAGLEAVKARGCVDEGRLAVSGWSYGGFMTGWMIGRHPKLWRAAVAGAAALDLTDMYALSDLNVQPRHALTGSPWTGDRETLFRAQSPLTYAALVRAPTLLLASAGDSRVAVSQSYKFFRALEDNGVEVKFFVYPTSGHWPAGPVRRQDIYRRWLDWIESHLR